jgi:hypothetical protein
MKVTVSTETQVILDKGQNNFTNPYFVAGIAYAQLRFDAESEVLSWSKAAVDELIYKLLIAEKIAVTDVLGNYTAAVKKKSNDKSELISDLATKLFIYRKKWHTKSELPEFEKTVDDILQIVGLKK